MDKTAQAKSIMQNLAQNGKTMTDADYEAGLSQIGSLVNTKYQDQFNQWADQARQVRANELQKNNFAQEVLSPFSSIAGTTGTALLDMAGYASDVVGNIYDKFGLTSTGSGFHSFAQRAQQGVQQAETYGVDMGLLGRQKVLGGQAALNAANERNQGKTWAQSVADNIGPAIGESAGTGAELVSMGVGGGEAATLKGAMLGGLKMGATYGAGHATKDISQGKPADQAAGDFIADVIGGTAGGAVAHGIGAGLGAVGTSIINTSLGRQLTQGLGKVTQDFSNVVKNPSLTPDSIRAAYGSAVDKLNSLRSGLAGLYTDSLKKPEVDMLSAITRDTTAARSLIEANKNQAFGDVFNMQTPINAQDMAQTTLQKMSDVGDKIGAPEKVTPENKATVMAQYEMPMEQQTARNKFLSWFSQLKGTLESNAAFTKQLDPYITASRPAFGGTGEYDKYASQILTSLRNDFKSYLQANNPDMAAQLDRGFNIKNQIDSYYKTGLMEGAQEMPSQQEMMRQIVSGELKGTDPQVATFMNSLSPTVKQNFKNALVNEVTNQAWDSLMGGKFSEQAYNAAAKTIDKFVNKYQGSQALDYADAFRLSEFSSMLKHDFTKEPMFRDAFLKSMGIKGEQGFVTEPGSAIAGKAQEAGKTAQDTRALQNINDVIQSGEISQVPSAYNKLSPERQSQVWGALDDQGKQYLGQSVLSSKVGPILDKIDVTGDTVDMTKLNKAIKSVVDDKALFENGFSPEQKNAINRLSAYLDGVTNLKQVNLDKAFSKILGGALLGAWGHRLWGLTTIMQGGRGLISDMLTRGDLSQKEIQAVIDHAKEFSGYHDPTSARLINWFGGLFNEKFARGASSQTGINVANKVNQ